MFHVQGSTASAVKTETSDSSKMDNGGGKSKCAVAVCPFYTCLHFLAGGRHRTVLGGVPIYTCLHFLAGGKHLCTVLGMYPFILACIFLERQTSVHGFGVVPVYTCLYFCRPVQVTSVHSFRVVPTYTCLHIFF